MFAKVKGDDLCHILFFSTMEEGELPRRNVKQMRKVRETLDLTPDSYSLIVNKVNPAIFPDTSPGSNACRRIRATLEVVDVFPAFVMFVSMFQELVSAYDGWFKLPSDALGLLLHMQFRLIRKSTAWIVEMNRGGKRQPQASRGWRRLRRRRVPRVLRRRNERGRRSRSQTVM